MYMERSPRVIERIIRKKLESLGYQTYNISLRDGFTIFMVETNNKRVIIWIRRAPLTNKAISLFTKMINKYEHDKVIILKIQDKADYIKIPKEFVIEKIKDTGSIYEILQKHIF